jgi:hypothetical protein
MKNLNKNITKIKQNNNFIVYIHIRPDINEPFYVGKGIPKRDKSKYGRNQYWHNIVNKNNDIFKSKILFEGLSEEEALLKKREIELDLKNKGYILSNIIECGIKAGTTGMKHSEESKRKISEGLKGRKVDWVKHTDITKQKIGEKNKYNNCKPILQIDQNNNIIKEWYSISEASQYYSYISNIKSIRSSISDCLRGKTKTSLKFKWKYKI